MMGFASLYPSYELRHHCSMLEDCLDRWRLVADGHPITTPGAKLLPVLKGR